MEAKSMTEDERFAFLSRTLIRKSLRLSLGILAITVGTCIVTAWVTSLPGTARFLKLVMATNSVFLAWANRRALLETGRFRGLLADGRLLSERRTLLVTMWSDRISLSFAAATFVYIMHSLLQGGGS
jgi:hypothetical protein